MLSKIIIKNFKSIKDLTVDLRFAEKKAPNNYKESDIISFIEPTKNIADRLVSIMNIYGANASGKSNIVQSLFSFKVILLNGIKAIPPFFSINKLVDLGKKSSLELEFFVNKKKYSYFLEYSHDAIQREVLKAEEKIFFEIKNNILQKNEILSDENFSYEDIQKKFEGTSIAPYKEEKIQIQTFIKFFVENYPSVNTEIFSIFEYLAKNITVSLGNAIPVDFSVDQLAKSSKEEDIQKAFLKISDFIKRLDIDIKRFEYQKNDISLHHFEKSKGEFEIPHIPHIPHKNEFINKKEIKITFSEIKSIHLNENEEEVVFRLNEESVGTQLSFGMIGIILKTLENGGVLIIDELDKSLHPLLLKSLLRVFKDKEYNTKNAQILCTLHSSDILEDDIYKMSEFLFVNKNRKNGTIIHRLSGFEGMRNDVNFRDRYLDGMYFGIPHPYN